MVSFQQSYSNIFIKDLHQAVKRNADRFPEDFMFKLTKEKWTEIERVSNMSSQNVMTSPQADGLQTGKIASYSNSVISPEGLIRVFPKCL